MWLCSHFLTPFHCERGLKLQSPEQLETSCSSSLSRAGKDAHTYTPTACPLPSSVKWQVLGKSSLCCCANYSAFFSSLYLFHHAVTVWLCFQENASNLPSSPSLLSFSPSLSYSPGAVALCFLFNLTLRKELVLHSSLPLLFTLTLHYCVSEHNN